MQASERLVAPVDRRLASILIGGLLAATIDIGAAALIGHRNPGFILQAIAGGMLGERTFALHAESMWLGFFLQELMGLIIASVYAIVGPRFPLPRGFVSRGCIYGVAVFVVMNFVVVPLSAWREVPHFTLVKLVENLAAMLLFGMIVAASSEWAARR